MSISPTILLYLRVIIITFIITVLCYLVAELTSSESPINKLKIIYNYWSVKLMYKKYFFFCSLVMLHYAQKVLKRLTHNWKLYFWMLLKKTFLTNWYKILKNIFSLNELLFLYVTIVYILWFSQIFIEESFYPPTAYALTQKLTSSLMPLKPFQMYFFFFILFIR